MRFKTPYLRKHWLRVGVFCLVLGCGSGFAQDSLWQKLLEEGNKHREQGRYSEAEKAYQVALAEAQKFGPEDPRLGESLNSLATVYQDTGRYGQAEPLYRRSLVQDQATYFDK